MTYSSENLTKHIFSHVSGSDVTDRDSINEKATAILQKSRGLNLEGSKENVSSSSSENIRA
jgi:hypothetical protein